MSDVTHILSQIDAGDSAAAEQLLPLVYDELRKLAAARLAQEPSGHTLQATALVHEAYLRLVGSDRAAQPWDSRRHFFGAAAEAMRRILVDNARRKASVKHGGHRRHRSIDEAMAVASPDSPDAADVVAVDEAMRQLAEVDATAAELVRLRFFGGLDMQTVAEVMGISTRSAYYTWEYARVWLHKRLKES